MSHGLRPARVLCSQASTGWEAISLSGVGLPKPGSAPAPPALGIALAAIARQATWEQLVCFRHQFCVGPGCVINCGRPRGVVCGVGQDAFVWWKITLGTERIEEETISDHLLSSVQQTSPFSLFPHLPAGGTLTRKASVGQPIHFRAMRRLFFPGSLQIWFLSLRTHKTARLGLNPGASDKAPSADSGETRACVLVRWCVCVCVSVRSPPWYRHYAAGQAWRVKVWCRPRDPARYSRKVWCPGTVSLPDAAAQERGCIPSSGAGCLLSPRSRKSLRPKPKNLGGAALPALPARRGAAAPGTRRQASRLTWRPLTLSPL